MTKGLLDGKKALILGVANERSIAWGVAKSFKEQGAQLAFTYAGDSIYKRLLPLSQEIQSDWIELVDVTQDQHLINLKNKVKDSWGTFDILVHSLAFANTQDLKGRISDVSRDGFKMALDISAYSLIALCSALRDLMNPGGSVMAMTYHGSQKVMKNYNIMGIAKAALEASMRYLAEDLGSQNIRVNCISAGPIKTLAAVGVSGFRSILKDVEQQAPLKRNITIEDVGGMATFLASDYSRSVTGQVMYVDAGHSIVVPSSLAGEES
jgi:enoyl-[acyl-carrier protein] reductase I